MRSRSLREPSRRVARVSIFWLLVLFAAGAVVAWPLLAQDKPPKPPRKPDPPAEKPADKPAETPKDTPDDEATRLLAEREKQVGPTWPGKDPAFLVLPRAAERGNMAYDLLTPIIVDMKERGLAYLVRTQNSDGSWSDTQYDSNTGVTALACLALMAEGSRSRVGRNLDRVSRGTAG